MITISPSILSCDFLNIREELLVLENEENLWVHLDVMDGHFVPNLTFGIPIINQLSKDTKLPLDCHLMVTNPLFHIKEMKDFGLKNITFHFEAVDNHLEIISFAKNHYGSVGISIKPNTPFSSLSKEILENIDLLLVMSVEPGFGGQGFIDDSVEKIREAFEYKNNNNLNYSIQVDGGINDITSKIVVDAGADNLVAGSYIFKSEKSNYIKKVNSLRNLK